MNKSGILPTGDRCLVEVIPEEKTSKGGIIILDSTVEANEAAKAEAILLESGPTVREHIKIWPADGARVLITKYAGVKYQPTPEDPHLRLVNWEDIVAEIRT